MLSSAVLVLLGASVRYALAVGEQLPLAIPHEELRLHNATQIEAHAPVFPSHDAISGKECMHTAVLMEHVFANSYGEPFVSDYEPPPCSFNQVIMNFTVFVRGRQFDRMGIMYLGDVEVFRTSTSEPSPNGVTWSYLKEMDMYNALWRQKQKLIFDLPNIVNEVYTGPLHTRLTGTFFYQETDDEREHADTILPISASRSADGEGSAFIVPGDSTPASHSFANNVSRAIVTLSACGQQEEEFWYTNVLSRDVDAFAATTGLLTGYSPFREVQLLIDGHLAGVSWPSPVIFTGGIAPGLWRPVVGIDVYDLQQQEIDITPWLGYLTDGQPHTFEIKVAGLVESGNRSAGLSARVGGYWVVTGTIFLFYGNTSEPNLEDSSLPNIHASSPLVSISSATSLDSQGRNETLYTRTSVRRKITTTNPSNNSTSYQYLHFQNTNHITNYGLDQSITQATTSIARSSSPVSKYSSSYLLRPTLALNSSLHFHPSDDGFSIHASLSHDQDSKLSGPRVFSPSAQNMQRFLTNRAQTPLRSSPLRSQAEAETIEAMHAQSHIHQNGSAVFRAGRRQRYSIGALDTAMDFTASQGGLGEFYQRFVAGENGTVKADTEGIAVWKGGRSRGVDRQNDSVAAVDAGSEGDVQEATKALGGRDSPRALLGRGPGAVSTGYLPRR